LDALPQSHTTLSKYTKNGFIIQQEVVRQHLQSFLSRVHITTDTWKCGPLRKELQAITARWVNPTGQLKKALLALKDMPSGHAGSEVSKALFATLEQYEIIDKIGYITSDNHSANDTMSYHLSELLKVEGVTWDPVRHRCRCLGHIINLAAQAFMTASSQKAIDDAIEFVRNSQTTSDAEDILAESEDGWQSANAIKKATQYVAFVRSSYSLINEFINHAGQTVVAPNTTRWNLWFNMLQRLLKLRESVDYFIAKHAHLCGQFILTEEDWQLIRLTVDFLQPFYQATIETQGDQITLERMQENIYFLNQVNQSQALILSKDKS
jgi:hypothetical protein